jgi:hypothetical protein
MGMSASGLPPRTRLEQLVRQSRWTVAEFQKDFARKSDQLDERLTVSTRQAARWIAGEVNGLPYPAACRVLEQMFGESAERLFGPPDPVSRVTVATVEALGPVSVGTEPAEDPAVQREVAMAASGSARFGQFAEQSNVGPHTLEQFRADLVRIVTNYTNRPVYPLFVELRALRNRAFELLEGRQHPEQTRELYLVAGALCGVLANASFHLGWLPAAETQARTAFLGAELAGNNALRAWIRGMQSLVAYWDERPRAAVELAADGWRYVPETGTARVRLVSIEARAHARLRDQRATGNAIARAEQAPTRFGGQTIRVGCSPSVRPSRASTRRPPAMAGQRRLGEICLARLDLTATRLGQDDLDGAAEQLQNVLAISAQRPIEPVSRRLHQVSRALQRPRYQTCALALGLHEQIRSFTRTSTSPGLPGANG